MGKTEYPGIYKDREGVLINKDNTSLTAYKRKKMNDANIVNVVSDVEQLKNDIAEIKEILKGLARR